MEVGSARCSAYRGVWGGDWIGVRRWGEGEGGLAIGGWRHWAPWAQAREGGVPWGKRVCVKGGWAKCGIGAQRAEAACGGSILRMRRRRGGITNGSLAGGGCYACPTHKVPASGCARPCEVQPPPPPEKATQTRR